MYLCVSYLNENFGEKIGNDYVWGMEFMTSPNRGMKPLKLTYSRYCPLCSVKYCCQTYDFEVRLLRRGFHTLIRNDLFPSQTRLLERGFQTLTRNALFSSRTRLLGRDTLTRNALFPSQTRLLGRDTLTRNALFPSQTRLLERGFHILIKNENALYHSQIRLLRRGFHTL